MTTEHPAPVAADRERAALMLWHAMDEAQAAWQARCDAGDPGDGEFEALWAAANGVLADALTSPAPAPSDETALLVLPDAEALRDHLDALNDSGTRTEAAGVDTHGNPFLITLQGPYAETESVLFGVPWDGEVDWNTPLRCDECGCREAFGIDALHYPVHVATDAATRAALAAQPSEGER